jgi:hypothetical protein
MSESSTRDGLSTGRGAAGAASVAESPPGLSACAESAFFRLSASTIRGLAAVGGVAARSEPAPSPLCGDADAAGTCALGFGESAVGEAPTANRVLLGFGDGPAARLNCEKCDLR